MSDKNSKVAKRKRKTAYSIFILFWWCFHLQEVSKLKIMGKKVTRRNKCSLPNKRFSSNKCLLNTVKIVLGGVYMRKLAPARVSYRDDSLILYRVYIMTGSFHIALFESTLYVDKIHVWFKIANIRHVLPVPVYWHSNFTPIQVVVSRLHGTVARFRTGVKFSPWYNNRGELTLRWLAPAWHFVVVSCQQI